MRFISKVCGAFKMLQIYFNNTKLILETTLSLDDFIKMQRLAETGFAVTVNQKFIPRGDYQKIILQHDDQIILLQPMQGG